ncbi:MAG: hypothetical protein Q8P93_04885 [bacterium]|nr:hypothetical protein [bacterium]
MFNYIQIRELQGLVASGAEQAVVSGAPQGLGEPSGFSEELVAGIVAYHQQNLIYRGVIESITADSAVVRTRVYDPTLTLDAKGGDTDYSGVGNILTSEVSIVISFDGTEFPLKEREGFAPGDAVQFVVDEPLLSDMTEVRARFFYNRIPGIN